MTDPNAILIVFAVVITVFGVVVGCVIGYDLITGRYKRFIRSDAPALGLPVIEVDAPALTRQEANELDALHGQLVAQFNANLAANSPPPRESDIPNPFTQPPVNFTPPDSAPTNESEDDDE